MLLSLREAYALPIGLALSECLRIQSHIDKSEDLGGIPVKPLTMGKLSRLLLMQKSAKSLGYRIPKLDQRIGKRTIDYDANKT